MMNAGVVLATLPAPQQVLVQPEAPRETPEERAYRRARNLIRACEACEASYDTMPYRFDLADRERWKPFLDQFGFVVIKSVANAEQVAEMRRNIDDYRTQVAIHMLDMDNKLPRCVTEATDRDKKVELISGRVLPGVMHGGMVKYSGFLDAQWQARRLMAPVYSRLWEVPVTELRSSFDAFAFVPGSTASLPGLRKEAIANPGSFLHVDQTPPHTGVYTVQGLLALSHADVRGGNFIVSPGSNWAHERIMRRWYKPEPAAPGHAKPRLDWWLFSLLAKREEPFLRKEHLLRVCVRAGDCVLWQSRTAHCNVAPIDKVDRVVVYVSMATDAQIAATDEKQRTRRIKMRTRQLLHLTPSTHSVLYPNMSGYRLYGSRAVPYLVKNMVMQRGPRNPVDLNLTDEQYEDAKLEQSLARP